MRKYLVASLVLFSSTCFAATHHTIGKVSQATHKKATYNCNWSRQPDIKRLLAELKYYHVTTLINPYSLRIVIPDYVAFKPMSTEFNANSQTPLKCLAQLLSKLPDAKIKVLGYTDNIPTAKFNQHQSMLRAQEISGFLWEHHIPNSTQLLNYYGRGETSPIAHNHRVNGMAMNRRTEVLAYLPH